MASHGKKEQATRFGNEAGFSLIGPVPTSPKTHRPHHLASQPTSPRTEYDRRRGSARERGYTAAWDVASKSFLAEPDNVLCLGCRSVGWVRLATVTDHVIRHRGDRDLFWDRSNWQPSCAPHHDVVKPRIEAMFDRGEIDAAGLRLDSEVARRLTRILLRP